MDIAVKPADEREYGHDKDDHDHDKDHHKHRKHKHHHKHHETRHIHELEKTIKALADVLAGFGRGAHLQELLYIIHRPGWTTPAELAFVNTILDSIAVQVRGLERLQADLVDAARKVRVKDEHR